VRVMRGLARVMGHPVRVMGGPACVTGHLVRVIAGLARVTGHPMRLIARLARVTGYAVQVIGRPPLPTAARQVATGERVRESRVCMTRKPLHRRAQAGRRRTPDARFQ
jgi:hypothetical protein